MRETIGIHVVLCVFQIPPEQKLDNLLSGKFPSQQKSEYRRSNSLRKTLLQRAVEHRRRSLILLRCLPEQPLLSSCGLLGTTTLEPIALREILLEEIQG
jgi:hypothetical protein